MFDEYIAYCSICESPDVVIAFDVDDEMLDWPLDRRHDPELVYYCTSCYHKLHDVRKEQGLLVGDLHIAKEVSGF